MTTTVQVPASMKSSRARGKRRLPVDKSHAGQRLARERKERKKKEREGTEN